MAAVAKEQAYSPSPVQISWLFLVVSCVFCLKRCWLLAKFIGLAAGGDPGPAAYLVYPCLANRIWLLYTPLPRAGKSLLLRAGAPWSRAVLSCCCDVFFWLAGALVPVVAVAWLVPCRLLALGLADFGCARWIRLNFTVQA